MDIRTILKKPVRLFTGKYGVLLLTLLNAALACLVVTLSNYWPYRDVLREGANTDFMTYFLLDYRVGFVSRAFIGSIFYLFTEHPTVRMVANTLYAAVLISLLLFSFFQAQLAKKALQKSEHAVLLLSYLFFLNSIFWCNAFEFFGLLDVFMTLTLQLYLLCAERNRLLRCALAPVVCFVGLLIHTSFFFVGFTVVAAILWFDLLQREKPDAVRVTLFCVTCALSVALFIIFVFFTQEMARVDVNELMRMIREKYDGPIVEEYHTAYLFRTSKDHPGISDVNFLRFIFNFSRTDFTSLKVRKHLCNVLPLTAAFFGGCVYHARRSGNRMLAYLGCLAPFVALFPALEFSTDKERFFSLFFLAQYMLLHYIVMQTNVCFLPGRLKIPQEIHLPRKNPLQNRIDCANLILTVCAVAGFWFTLHSYFNL